MPAKDRNIDDYTIEIRRKGSDFYLSVPELGLVSQDDDLGRAHDAIRNRMKEVFEHHQSLGTTARIPLPRHQAVRRELTPFFIKAGAVALVGVFLFAVGSMSFSYALREPLKNHSQRAGRALMDQIAKGLTNYGDKDVKREKEEKIREGIRRAVPKLKPYVNELKPLFKSDSKAPSHPADNRTGK